MDEMGLRSISKMITNRGTVALKAVLLPSLLLSGVLLLSGCGGRGEPADDKPASPEVLTSAEREKRIEKAREEALAYLATRQTNAPPPPAPATTPGTRVLENAQASPEELSRVFLRALAGRDLAVIKSLRLTKEEFCQYIFPELPSSKVPNLTCDFAWEQATLRSLSGLDKMYTRHQGRKYELVSVRFEKGTESYTSYRVYKETHLTVRDETGAQAEIRLFGSMLEMDGKYKLFSFVSD